MFPQVPAPDPPVPTDGCLFGMTPAERRLVSSVTPAQIVGSLARLQRDGRVRMTRDSGWPGTERWCATDY